MLLLTLACRFIDLDTPLLLAEDPVVGGYEGIHPISLMLILCSFVLRNMQYSIIIDLQASNHYFSK